MSNILAAFDVMFRKIQRRLDKKVYRPLGRLLYRVDQEDFAAALRRVGLTSGAAVCVHSSLSRLGQVIGGADAVIDALMDTVGPEGRILMPTFPTTVSMASYLDSEGPFDVRHTPSKVGLITEVFRHRPGVSRSLHPTNPVAAWGRGAEALIQDHEQSPTPYGHETPYGRLAKEEKSFILMIETHILSFLHHLQERVHFPHFFLPESRNAAFVDGAGRQGTMSTRVMRPRVPYFVAIPAASGPEPDWAMIQDFALTFPRRRERDIRRLGYRFKGYRRLHRRRIDMEEAGILRATRVGRGEIGLLHVRGFLQMIEPELRELIERFRPFYDPERIAAMNLPYL